MSERAAASPRISASSSTRRPASAIAAAGSRVRSSGRFRNTRPALWRLARSAGTLVGIVLALAGAEPQPLRQRRALRLQFGVGVKRGLVLPQFEQDQRVRIEDALEHLELFAAGILPGNLAARLHRLCEFGAFAGCRVERDDEPDRHGLSSRA